MTSPSKLTVTAPPQLSLVVTLPMLGAGTWPTQLTVTGAGQLMLGAVVSLTVTPLEHKFWQLLLSVTVRFRVKLPGHVDPAVTVTFRPEAVVPPPENVAS